MPGIQFSELPHAWQGFFQACASCTACDLSKSRSQVVIYRGALQAPLLIIGEGPGREEDRLGQPFVGRSGHLLDAALRALEFPEDSYHICNIVKCRPPENRTPLPEEAAACRKFLNAQFQLVKPSVILLMGSPAYRYFTGRSDPISRVRGVWIEKGGYDILPTFHPAYILRNQRMRDVFWEDFRKLREKMEERQLLQPLAYPFPEK